MDLTIEFKNQAFTINALLNQTETAKSFVDILPINSPINLWGEEIYFPVDLYLDNELPQETVNIGDIAYWPPGNAFCIFFGETPASVDGNIKPASAVTVIGKLESDPEVLKRVKSGENIIIRRDK
ncbi:MAG: hypothetical protein FI721_04345 [SAR202 cluster bacterium]|nr:hypothetical protein [Chloroflexota bacterium]MQG16877.1 hypothetical protein [SAR202 cluster bacterium]MQG35962.1 hypothetical protein [SAR202 cluster bacterium]MQG86323.1 hypothetical protein [SAR202 cluster bacterium]|tara:strand:- start:87 stop:461 length:375 start_codon:yes stop_codon:yes gene_type:complete